MSKISIKIKEDIRNVLKSGEEYVFDFEHDDYNKDPFIIITGNNGSGKSTLLNCIRNYKCDNVGEHKSSDGGKRSMKLSYLDIRDFTDKCEIETDFEKIFFLSSEFDDPMSFKNCGDASDFIAFGGFSVRNKSNGEKMLLMLSEWIVKNKEHLNDRTLVVFDEIDRGYDLRYQKGMLNMLNKLHKEHGVHFLIVVHNLLPILLTNNYLYVMDFKHSFSSKGYLLLKAGIEIESIIDLDKEKDGI